MLYEILCPHLKTLTAMLFQNGRMNLKNVNTCIEIHFSSLSHQSKRTQFFLKLLWNKHIMTRKQAEAYVSFSQALFL